MYDAPTFLDKACGVSEEVHEEFGSEKAESETEPGTEGEEHDPPVRRLCTQKPSDGDQEAKQRALNVGKHLYRMNAVMERCEQLQDKGFVGGVTMEAQKELSRRSTARIQRGHKAGTGDGRRILGGIVEAKRRSKKLGQHGTARWKNSCSAGSRRWYSNRKRR